MTKLTEDIIRQRLRNCSSPLNTIIKINITGRDLEDITLLREMSAIEVLSLSVNKISTLIDLQYCKNLKELYLRKNNISNLDEIYYLRELPYLTVLGMSQNPCSSDPNYRMTIIKNLTRLEKLDDIPVVPEERVEAFKKGRKIRNPKELGDDSSSTYDMSFKYIEEVESKMKDDSVGQHYGGEVTEKCHDPEKVCRLREKSPSQAQIVRSSSTSPCRQPGNSSPERSYHDGPVVYGERNGSLRDSNILSGILMLVKELDYPSLELLSLNIKNRIKEHQITGYY